MLSLSNTFQSPFIETIFTNCHLSIHCFCFPKSASQLNNELSAGHVVKPGHAYKVNGWTKLVNASKEDLHRIELWIRYQGNEVKNRTETRIILAQRDKYNNSQFKFNISTFHGRKYLKSYVMCL